MYVINLTDEVRADPFILPQELVSKLEDLIIIIIY